MKTFPRPTRRANTDETRIEPTPAGHAATMPTTPIDYELTPRGKGETLPRYQPTREECQKGYRNAVQSLLRRFPNCDPHFLMCAIMGSKPWHTLPDVQRLMHRDEPLTDAEAVRHFASE